MAGSKKNKSNKGVSVSKVKGVEEELKEKIKGLESALNDMKSKVEELRNDEELRAKLKRVKHKAEEGKSELEELVKEYPLLSVSVAVGLGVLIGKLLRD